MLCRWKSYCCGPTTDPWTRSKDRLRNPTPSTGKKMYCRWPRPLPSWNFGRRRQAAVVLTDHALLHRRAVGSGGVQRATPTGRVMGKPTAKAEAGAMTNAGWVSMANWPT